MRFRRRCALLPLILLFGGFLPPGSLSLVHECRCETLASLPNTTIYIPEGDLEQELLTLTNRQRMQKGLPPLVPDTALTQIARKHSNGMAQQGFISHDQPLGDLKTRMHSAGYLYEVVRENVACASTVTIAQNLLINSPPHKENILAEDVTRVGIGIVRYKPPFDRQLYITEIFAVPRKEYPASAVQNMAVSRVNDLKRQSGSASVQPDPQFENLALRSVSSLKVPVEREELKRLLVDSADELQREGRKDLSRLDVAVQLLHNPENLSIPGQAGKKEAGMFGTAVRKVSDYKNQTAFLVLTLIGFTR
jgi:hypothetical protein